jgi:hypothetical protein
MSSVVYRMVEITIPIRMGKMDPTVAISTPLVPISFNVETSMSIPASKTNRIRLERRRRRGREVDE